MRFIDPSGHFTEDAIKEYLESIYGDDWKKYWDEWSADKEWMNLLRKAQAGDILTRLIDGKANSYQFFGEGEKVLGGIASIAEISPNPEYTGLGDLNSVFRNQGNGLGVMGFINEGNGIIVRATKGAISYSIHSVTTQDVDGKNAIISGAISVVVAPWNPWIGIATGFASGYLSRQIGQIPGLVVGDLELTIGSYNSSTSTRWGYEYTFRNGQCISTSGYSYQIPNYPIPPLGP